MVSHAYCFYLGLCDPLEETEHRIRETYPEEADRPGSYDPADAPDPARLPIQFFLIVRVVHDSSDAVVVVQRKCHSMERVKLTQREQGRLQVLNSVLAEHMTLNHAAALMDVSVPGAG